MLLNLISPFTYEKRLNKLIDVNKNKKIKKNSKPKFYNTEKGFFKKKNSKAINSFNNNNYFFSDNNTTNITENSINKKIIIERENMGTTTKDDTI